MCAINCSGGCYECSPEDHPDTLLKEAIALIKRQVERSLGDCQIYWDYDAKEFLSKVGAK